MIFKKDFLFFLTDTNRWCKKRSSFSKQDIKKYTIVSFDLIKNKNEKMFGMKQSIIAPVMVQSIN